MAESEKYLETRLRKEVKKAGGVALKFSSGTEVGFPDRCVLMPGGICHWVELKTTGARARKMQSYRHEQLRRLGFRVEVIDTSDKLNQFINSLYGISDGRTEAG